MYLDVGADLYVGSSRKDRNRFKANVLTRHPRLAGMQEGRQLTNNLQTGEVLAGPAEVGNLPIQRYRRLIIYN